MKICFIINPISGGKKKAGVEKLIHQEFDNQAHKLEIAYTQYRGHATELAKNAIDKNFDTVVAVGGDGTVNEVGVALIGSKVSFGIIPMGSGNGLARFLKIPMNVHKAIKTIYKNKAFEIDTIRINHHYFLNVAGLGFDAHIGHLFANYGKRGFISYVRLIVKEFFKYRNNTYHLLIDGEMHQVEALLVSFANSSQFGNEAHIAPLAEINDGLIDVCILKKFPWWKSILLAILLYSKGLTKSKYYKVLKTNSLKVINKNPLKAHIDGDPIVFDGNINLQIVPKSLKILVP